MIWHVVWWLNLVCTAWNVVRVLRQAVNARDARFTRVVGTLVGGALGAALLVLAHRALP